MAAPHRQPITPEDYLLAERQSEGRHELVNGSVYAMSGASFSHINIVGNLYHHLRNLLKDGCRVLMSDMRVKVPDGSLYTYPDLTVICGEPEFEDSHVDTLLNPLVLIEVLSPSTEAYDRGTKLIFYRSIPSLRAYVLVSQSHTGIEAYIKNDAGEWTHHFALGRQNEFSLPPLGVSLSLQAVYEGVEASDRLPELPKRDA